MEEGFGFVYFVYGFVYFFYFGGMWKFCVFYFERDFFCSLKSLREYMVGIYIFLCLNYEILNEKKLI